MKSIQVTITDKIGIHARPAAMLVSEASKYDFDIKIKKGSQEANLKSIMSVVALAVKCNDTVEIVADTDDDTCLENIKNIMKNKKLIK